MINTLRNRIRHSPESSQAIGEAASQQIQAYNFAVDYTLAHPNVTKYDLFKAFTEHRTQKPERWVAYTTLLRGGLTRGYNSVKSFDKATLNTLRECRKEQSNKPFRHTNQNPDTRRLLRSRKGKLVVFVDDATSVRVINPTTIKVAGITLNLIRPILLDTTIKSIQVLERKSSLRCGRNSPLSTRKYDVHIQIEVPDPVSKNLLDNPVGLDTGIANTLADSDGNFHEQPVVSQERIHQLQTRQKGCTRGSRQYRKLKRLIRKELRYHRNVKDDWEHRVAKHIAETYSLVVVEDLKHKQLRRSAKGTAENPGRNVSAKKGLNRSWAITRPAMLHTKLARHCEKTGTGYMQVDAKFTSTTCPVCGLRASGSRKSQAEFTCLDCGFNLNADIVGAINILHSGVAEEVHRGMGKSSLGGSVGILRTIWHGLENSRTVHEVPPESLSTLACG